MDVSCEHSALVGLTEFSAGIVCGLIFLVLSQKTPSRKRMFGFELIAGMLVLSLIMVALLDLSVFGLAPTSWPLLPALFGGLVLFTALGNGRFGVTALLESPPVYWLGLISYSFYLYHDLVLWNVYNRFPSALEHTVLAGNVGKACVAFVLTVVVSWASFELIETRLTRRLGLLLNRPASTRCSASP
jgi:peptidoglycan/LPS O-acetylase OafA/YrhL